MRQIPPPRLFRSCLSGVALGTATGQVHLCELRRRKLGPPRVPTPDRWKAPLAAATA